MFAQQAGPSFYSLPMAPRLLLLLEPAVNIHSEQEICSEPVIHMCTYTYHETLLKSWDVYLKFGLHHKVAHLAS